MDTDSLPAAEAVAEAREALDAQADASPDTVKDDAVVDAPVDAAPADTAAPAAPDDTPPTVEAPAADEQYAEPESGPVGVVEPGGHTFYPPVEASQPLPVNDLHSEAPAE